MRLITFIRDVHTVGLHMRTIPTVLAAFAVTLSFFSNVFVDSTDSEQMRPVGKETQAVLGSGLSLLSAASWLTPCCLIAGQAGWGAPMCGQLQGGHSLVGVFVAGGWRVSPDLLIALWQSTSGSDDTHCWPAVQSIIQGPWNWTEVFL